MITLYSPLLPPSLPPSLPPCRTLVYELALNELPYARDAVTSVIWKVGNGESQSLSRSIQHSSKLREIVHSCWTGNPSARPSFDELMSHLSHNVSFIF